MNASRPFFIILAGAWLCLSATCLWAKTAPPAPGQAPANPFRTEAPLLQGLWVDPRTGSDFLQVERRGHNWTVTAYGGEPTHPRYMSRGVLTQQASGELTGLVKDLPGQCCGNQGRLSLRPDQGDRLSAQAFWWPQGQPDPGTDLGEAYALERVRVVKAPPVAPVDAQAAPTPQASANPTPGKAALSRVWSGAWQGEGWGRFLMAVRGRQLYILWYYGQPEGPKFHGRYQLSADLGQAKGQAYGPVSASATYFRHELALEGAAGAVPQARLSSWRLAAPLDDGRLVRFKEPQLSNASLVKKADALTPEEAALLKEFMDDPNQDPVKLYERAVDKASRGGKLVKR